MNTLEDLRGRLALIKENLIFEYAGTCIICTSHKAHNGDGYVKIYHKGSSTYLHHLVCTVFYGPCPANKERLHSCDNPRCVNPEHLRYGSQKQNRLDMYLRGNFPKALGDKNPNYKLDDAQIIAIRTSQLSNGILASFYGVDKSYVSRIKRNQERILP